MFSSYFKNFYQEKSLDDFFSLLSSLIPDPEIEIDIPTMSMIYDRISSAMGFNVDLLIKFLIMKGYSPSNLLSFIDQKQLTLNIWDWIRYDARLRGDTTMEKTAENFILNKIQELQNQNLFIKIEHWLFLFDPRARYIPQIRLEAKKELEALLKQNNHQYYSVFNWMLIIEHEWESITEPDDIQELNKILSRNDWDILGSYWELTILDDLVRLQLDFSDITNATIVISEMKNFLEDSPLFLGTVLRHEGKIQFMEGNYDESDSLIASSLYFFSQSHNYKQTLFTQFLQIKLWSTQSKKRVTELLSLISLDNVNKVSDPWIFGNYHLMLANLDVAKNQYTQAINHYLIGIENIRNSYDKIAYWHALIDYGFCLFSSKKFSQISDILPELISETVPTMIQLRGAYLNAATLYRLGDVDEAIQALEGTLQSVYQVIDNPQLPWFYSLLGEIYRIQGQWLLCEDYFKLASKAYYQINDIDSASRAKIGQLYQSIILQNIDQANKLGQDLLITLPTYTDLKLEVIWALEINKLYNLSTTILSPSKQYHDWDQIGKEFLDSNFFELLNTFIKAFSVIIDNKNSEPITLNDIQTKIFISNDLSEWEEEWLSELYLDYTALILKLNIQSSEMVELLRTILDRSKLVGYPFSITENNFNNWKKHFFSDLSPLIIKNNWIESFKLVLLTAIQRASYRVLSKIYPVNFYD